MIDWASEKYKARAIGELYFTADRDEQNRPISKYSGKVVGFIIQRDDGSEYELRAEKQLPLSKLPLEKRDLANLKIGSAVLDVATGTTMTVTRIYQEYGDVWVKDAEGRTHAKKYNDLKRVS
jgi:hypothetical protein